MAAWGMLDLILALALQGPGADLSAESRPPMPPPTPPAERRFTLDVINDGLATIYDEGYTSGVRLLWRGGPPIDALALRRALPEDLERRLAAEYWVFGLAHEMWTPVDLETALVSELTDDRPYAGLLSAEAHTDLVFAGGVEPAGYTRASARLVTGVTGDWSLSEPIQKGVHDGFRVLTQKSYPKDPQGWDVYEVPETVLVNLRLGIETEVMRLSSPGPWSDLTGAPFGTRAFARADCDLGTMRIGCEMGATLRVGWLPEITLDGGTPIMETAGPTPLPISGHLFGGARIGAVAYDALLDGPLGTSGPTGDRRTVRAHLEIGALVQLWAVEIAYAYVVQTNEQSPIPRWAQPLHRMGHVRLSYRL